MKTIFKKISIPTLVLMVLVSTGCKKDYLDTVPPTRLSTETIFSTTENAEAAINGMHRILYVQWYGRQSEGGQSGNMLYMDVLGEDMVMTAQANGWLVSEYRWLAQRNELSTFVRYN